MDNSQDCIPVRFYVIVILWHINFYIFVRPTGWHGESGAMRRGGHLTVHFVHRIGRRGTTHHVYSCNGAYRKWNDLITYILIIVYSIEKGILNMYYE